MSPEQRSVLCVVNSLSHRCEGHGYLSVFKKGSLTAWKANEALITNFKWAAQSSLLEVKGQVHHSPNREGKFNSWLIGEAWNTSGLFCIISWELALLIQCMKIVFIETFIKAVGANLTHPGRTWRREKSTCQSLSSSITCSQSSLLSPSFSGDACAFVGAGKLIACGRNVMAERPWVLHLLIIRHLWGTQPLSSPSGADVSLSWKDNSSSYNKGFRLPLPFSHLTPLHFLLWVGFLEAPKKSWLAPI